MKQKAWIVLLGSVAAVFAGITIYGVICMMVGTIGSSRWWELFGPIGVSFGSYQGMRKRISQT